MQDKYNIHVVAGPTASGKTDYAIKLAQEIGGELINADSRQIYKYLDIGTNKGAVELLKWSFASKAKGQLPVFELENSGILIHLLSFLEPDQRFSAYEYQQLVFELIPQIVERGHVPILVGGTGLYIDFVLHPERHRRGTVDAQLREELDQLTLDELQQRLTTINSDARAQLNNSDWNNPRRLVRKIEQQLSEPVADNSANLQVDAKVHYLKLPDAGLSTKITDRVEQMFTQGLIEEVQNVLDKGYASDCAALCGIGYKEALALLQGKHMEAECKQKIMTEHLKYAKRQKRWFKKYLLG